jgi:hypothetical protein
MRVGLPLSRSISRMRFSNFPIHLQASSVLPPHPCLRASLRLILARRLGFW